jgi:integrase
VAPRRLFVQAGKDSIYSVRKLSVDKMSRDQKRNNYLTRNEFSVFLKAIHLDESHHALLAHDLLWFLGNYGLRITEALDLEGRDIRQAADWGTLRVIRLKKREWDEKRKEWRYLPPQEENLPLHKNEIGPLLEMAKRRGTDGKVFPLGKRKAEYLFTYYLDQSGLMNQKPWLRLHSLRHTCGVILYEDTGNLEFVRIRLGHESILTTQIYATMSSKKQLEFGSKREIVS